MLLAVAGIASIALPTFMDGGRARYPDSWLPIVRESIENLTLDRGLGLVFAGIVVGAFSRLRWIQASFWMISGFIGWSCIDILLYGGHSLFPMELAIYLLMGVVAGVGIAVGKLVRLGCSPAAVQKRPPTAGT